MSDKIGIVKEVDSLGRIHIPKELRRLYKIDHEIEPAVTAEGILIRNPQYVLTKKRNANAISH